MILNTGCRTDIPAYFSEWFYNRIKAGYVLTRNPYYPAQVIKYRLDPKVVDGLCFCTKNPAPMLARLSELCAFRQFWFVTITPYGKEIEPDVPEKAEVIRSVQSLAETVGAQAVGWRYDPIFISEKYTVAYHMESFRQMAKELAGSTTQCVISFIDLYEKTRKNFPEVRAVRREERLALGEAFVKIGKEYNITIHSCCEGIELAPYGVDTTGCMTQQTLEKALGCNLILPKKKPVRADGVNGCDCVLGNDIGMYNTCMHGCVYCYANYDMEVVAKNVRQHKKDSPFLVGEAKPDDIVKEAKQISYVDDQLRLF